MHPAPTGRTAARLPAVSSPLLRWSTLLQGHHLIPDPELRLRALSALWVAATTLDAPRRTVRQALYEATEQMVSRRPDLDGLWPLLEARLEAAPDPTLPDTIAAMVASPAHSDRHSDGLIPVLLELGLVDEARAQAAALPGNSPRQRARRTHMVRLAATGILGWRDTRRFVPAPHSAHRFPPSLPAFVRCAAALISEDASAHTPAERARAERLRAQLSPADQQAAHAHWVLVRWRLDGAAGALQELAGIRYRSHRAEAGLRLLETCLLAGDQATARRCMALLPTAGQSRAQARALLSAEAEAEDGALTLLPAEAVVVTLPTLSVARTLAVLQGEAVQVSSTLTWARHHLRSPPVLRQVLAALDPQGPLLDQLPMLRERLGEQAAVRLWSEHLTISALALAAEATPTTCRPSLPPPQDDRARALYDEQLSLHEAGWSRRRVLSHACRAVLLRGGADWPIRLRTLGHLGGEVASNALCEIASRARPEIAEAAAETLAAVDPARARAWLSDSADQLSPAVLTGILTRLSLARQVPAVLPGAWRRLWEGALNLLGEEAAVRFCQGVLVAWRVHAGGLPTAAALGGALAELRADPVAVQDGQLFVRALESLREVLRQDPAVLAGRLREDAVLRSRLRWGHPERLPPRAVPWSDAELLAVLERVPAVGETSSSLMAPILSVLRGEPARRAEIGRHLWQGSCPPPVPSSWSLGGVHRLRFLDKRVDLLTWMRFADAAPCCWQNARSSATVRARLLSVWKDPLSFCFQVERSLGSAHWPVGFVFGSLGRVEASQEGVVALLNGVYLQRQQGRLRDRILAAIESHVAALGVRWVAVASQYNGMGPMPDRYRRADRTVRRPRALTVHGSPVTFAMDDVSGPINATLRLRHLFWTEIPVSECKQDVSSFLPEEGMD